MGPIETPICKFLKMEARMLKITKIVRTTTTAANNSLIGRNIRNTYRPEMLSKLDRKTILQIIPGQIPIPLLNPQPTLGKLNRFIEKTNIFTKKFRNDNLCLEKFAAKS